jgi:transcriptional regulator NrdR family protein
MCPTCGKEPNKKTDAREVSRERDIDIKYLYHCGACYQLLTGGEDAELRRAATVARCTVPED